MKPLAVLYAIFSALGLITAVYFGGPYLSSEGASVAGFIALANINAPAATLSVDILVTYLFTTIFIVAEGRRLGMKHIWLYVLGSTVIAVAAGLALFLAFRERKLASSNV